VIVSNSHLFAVRIPTIVLLSMFLLPGCGQDDNQPTSEATTKTPAELIEAAEQGNAVSQYNLEIMHYKGQGIPQDYQEAEKWVRLAAEQEVAAAQYNLGFMYANGEGVPQDYQESLKWYRMAAEQGDGGAQNNLGAMYENGWGVPQDYVQAHG